MTLGFTPPQEQAGAHIGIRAKHTRREFDDGMQIVLIDQSLTERPCRTNFRRDNAKWNDNARATSRPESPEHQPLQHSVSPFNSVNEIFPQ